ncbi:alpha/beta hydrolase [Sediminitomix flava]|nr:alpha/beta hydrolase family protein [Sediminitomix flava]
MNKDIQVTVLLPNDYDRDKLVHFPVLYLLHGFDGGHKSFIDKIKFLDNYVDNGGYIVVCPDGGTDSWYLDSPMEPAYKYTTFIGTELVEHIDQFFRTIPKKEARGIAGISMGGFGAFHVAFRKPQTFFVIGSMSGVVDFRLFSKHWERWGLIKLLGEYVLYEELWDQEIIVNQLKILKENNYRMIIDCGLNDEMINVNRNLHDALVKEKIPHTYIERPGAHDWDYWNVALRVQMDYFKYSFYRE